MALKPNRKCRWFPAAVDCMVETGGRSPRMERQQIGSDGGSHRRDVQAGRLA